MPFARSCRCLSFFAAPLLLLLYRSNVQAPAPPSPAASLTMEQEHHHQLVFENSYVKAFYVEIPAHEATLYHRHDLPYVSLPPPPIDEPTRPASARGRETAPGPRVGYMPGGFSHAVSNSGDAPLRNVAVELLRPQGAAQNRCAEAVRGQPLSRCDQPTSPEPSLSYHYTLFETDEIIVEYHVLPPDSTFRSGPNSNILVGDLNGVTADAPEGVRAEGSFFEPQSGLVWVPAGSTTIFKAATGGVGHFIAIDFKDSKPGP
jgi:hypothetical protein